MGIDSEMLIRTKTKITNKQITEYAWRLAHAIGSTNFYIWDGQRSLTKVKEFEQDGPTLFPLEDEVFMRCVPATRYYGIDYGRGNIWLIISIAEWCERNISNVEVWYGGDSSGVVVRPFGSIERQNIIKHWSRSGNTYANDISGFDNEDWGHPFCVFCDHYMHRFGFGDVYAMYICQGCGQKVCTHNAGKLWTTERIIGDRKINDETYSINPNTCKIHKKS